MFIIYNITFTRSNFTVYTYFILCYSYAMYYNCTLLNITHTPRLRSTNTRHLHHPFLQQAKSFRFRHTIHSCISIPITGIRHCTTRPWQSETRLTENTKCGQQVFQSHHTTSTRPATWQFARHERRDKFGAYLQSTA